MVAFVNEDPSMLGCSEQLLSEYIDGDLSPTVAREVEHHLWSCAACRETFLELLELIAIVDLAFARGAWSTELRDDSTCLGHAFSLRPAGRPISRGDPTSANDVC
jgi:hypothetical protein